MVIFTWREIQKVPNCGGVYAWYFRPEIADYDCNKFVENLNALASNPEQCVDYIRQFLKSRLFNFFQEQPYISEIYGPLKPSYKGEIVHQNSISESLVERLRNEPERIFKIKNILEKSVPNFSSPLYIGMSKNLNKRLSTHKKLIEKYLENPNTSFIDSEASQQLLREHSFAKEIVQRGMSPALLSVYVQSMADVSDEWVDVENLLNRIHFPLLGRN